MLALVDELGFDERECLSDEQRTEREAEIVAQMLQVERMEEQLIMHADDVGTAIARRDTADARAVLGLSDALPAPTR